MLPINIQSQQALGVDKSRMPTGRYIKRRKPILNLLGVRPVEEPLIASLAGFYAARNTDHIDS